jgi:hypothetical protein
MGGIVTARGPLAPLTVWLSDLATWTDRGASLSSLFHLPSSFVVLGALAVLVILLRWLPRAEPDSGSWSWAVTGVVIGCLGVLAWITGAPAGWHWGLSMTGPSRSLLETVLLRDARAFDWGTAMLIGLVLGSWGSARLKGPIAWRAPATPELARRGAGGVLMGVGGTLAAGCNIGNALTGLSILAVHSVIATAGIALGGALALQALRRSAALGTPQPRVPR